MIRRMLRALTLAALLVAAVPAAALAKGPTAAEISGPGLVKPASLRMSGEQGGGTTLSTIVEETGLFPAMWAQAPNPLLPGRPEGLLGPRYTVVYEIPDGSTADRIRQELYPFAPGGPVAFTAPGQRIYDATTVGGWYRGSASRLLPVLADLGVPKAADPVLQAATPPKPAAQVQTQAPAPAAPPPAPAPSGRWVPPITVAITLLVGVGLVVLGVRRRAGAGRRAAASH